VIDFRHDAPGRAADYGESRPVVRAAGRDAIQCAQTPEPGFSISPPVAATTRPGGSSSKGGAHGHRFDNRGGAGRNGDNAGNPNETPKRWRLPGGTINGLAHVTAGELADLATAVSLLRRENMRTQADSAEGVISKMRALLKRPVAARIEPDLEALTEAEGLAMRPGPKPKINGEIISTLREAIITRRKVRLHYLYRGSGKRGYQVAAALSNTSLASMTMAWRSPRIGPPSRRSRKRKSRFGRARGL
jgi:hypothetical protein